MPPILGSASPHPEKLEACETPPLYVGSPWGILIHGGEQLCKGGIRAEPILVRRTALLYLH
jgi:hypothetical protein